MNNNMPSVNTLKLYRMPWTMSDNPFCWLEPTRNCDLSCEYCYQKHDPESIKTLNEFEEEIRGVLRLRKCDAVNIAGGEPLTHPQIIDIVKLVSSYGLKPVLITNGKALTKGLLHSLKKAGAFGFTFHVDSLQHRPGWNGKNETELNKLRQQLADMVYEEGGLVCGFNTTVVPSMLHHVGNIIEWTIRNNDRVATNLIIPVRMASSDDTWDYYAGTNKININDSVYMNSVDYRPMTAMELYRETLKQVPGFRFNSFLGGTAVPNAPKWLFSNPISSGREIYGYLGSKSMEIIQNGFHLFKGRFMSYLRPWIYRSGRMLFLLALADPEIRKTLFRYIKSVIRNPLRLFERVCFQTIILMQPQDILENGEQDQCDGCPNKTYYKGRLVSECRMEDYLNYGRMIHLVKRCEASNSVSASISCL